MSYREFMVLAALVGLICWREEAAGITEESDFVAAIQKAVDEKNIGILDALTYGPRYQQFWSIHRYNQLVFQDVFQGQGDNRLCAFLSYDAEQPVRGRT